MGWFGRGRRSGDDRGAGALDYTAMILVIALTAGTVLFVMTSRAPGIGADLRRAVCEILSLGQGDCGAGGDGDDRAEDRKPTEPCVLSSSGNSVMVKGAVIVVTAENGRSFEVARLNDGRYRVTALVNGGVGAEVGVGGGISVTVQDNAYGGVASADVGGGLKLNAGQVWYTDDEKEVERLISEYREDMIEDGVLKENSPQRKGWETLQDIFGRVTGREDYEFPEPDETYVQGGTVVGAGAEAVGLAPAPGSAGISVGATQMLGVRTTRDGSRTFYLRTTAEGEAGLQSLGIDTSGVQFHGAKLQGQAELVTAVTVDATGALRDVSTTMTAAGESKGLTTALFGGEASSGFDNATNNLVIHRASLPIRTSADRKTAFAFLAATGAREILPDVLGMPATIAQVYATDRFMDAARDRGTVTQQQFERDTTTVAGVKASGELGVELGIEATYDTVDLTSTGAEYWDGQGWRAWEGCAA